MKCFLLIALLAAGLGPASALGLSPVSRVAQLLKDLASKIDSELDTESKLYDDYVCWATTVVSTKEASNEKAQSRVDSLKTYLADLDAGRIELTTERSDLEKEVSGLKNDLEMAKALRNKENADYTAATNEIGQATKALDEAIKVLDEATKGSKSSLVSLRGRLSQVALEGNSEGFGARVEEAEALEQAVAVGSRYLKQGDALFLRRLLSGEVPNADWKKLNRKAEFKMKYKARSVKIQSTLQKLLASFTQAKDDADKKEKDAKDTYDSLKKAKESQLTASQDSLTKQEVEGGAAGVSKTDAKAEIDALETQITDDTKYISETKTALTDKKKEFSARKVLRVGEIAAINKAISVIHSDGARDLFKRSISLIQLDTVAAAATVQANAVLTGIAQATGDLRLSALAARIGASAGAKFDKVISAVDKMVKVLEDEDTDDQSKKADCEKDRTADTKEAKDLSRAIDDLSDEVTKLEGEIKQINIDVEEKETNVKNVQKEIKDAKKIRSEENTEWNKNDKDDSSAIKLLQDAAGVLKTFYKDNFSMVQKKQAQTGAHVVKAGAAPPPPPTTWSGDYGGAKSESTGIVGILEEIKVDVEKDQTAAKTAEDTAQTAHDKFVKESEGSIKNLNTAINDLNDSKGKKEKEITDKKGTSGTKKGSLDSVVQKMKDAAPACDFLLVNFKVRADNRKLEIDGLNKAKGILEAKNK